jgi:hypothetical protein
VAAMKAAPRLVEAFVWAAFECGLPKRTEYRGQSVIGSGVGHCVEVMKRGTDPPPNLRCVWRRFSQTFPLSFPSERSPPFRWPFKLQRRRFAAGQTWEGIIIAEFKIRTGLGATLSLGT